MVNDTLADRFSMRASKFFREFYWGGE